ISIFCVIPVFCLAEEEGVAFNPQLTSTLNEYFLGEDQSFEDTGFNRAILSISLLLDAGLESDEVSDFDFDSADIYYLGRIGKKNYNPIYDCSAKSFAFL
ncbi:MAG: hypothetical protein J6S50_10225, partial [Oscillospiraceae bacterium]|nr:hypothetical protein [Oscillospiraceae bacterium]